MDQHIRLFLIHEVEGLLTGIVATGRTTMGIARVQHVLDRLELAGVETGSDRNVDLVHQDIEQMVPGSVLGGRDSLWIFARSSRAAVRSR